jgi:hypothetical protein
MMINVWEAIKQPEIFRGILIRGMFKPYSWEGLICAYYFSYLWAIMPLLPFYFAAGGMNRSIKMMLDDPPAGAPDVPAGPKG